MYFFISTKIGVKREEIRYFPFHVVCFMTKWVDNEEIFLDSAPHIFKYEMCYKLIPIMKRLPSDYKKC
jgi:hypothetical protein